MSTFGASQTTNQRDENILGKDFLRGLGRIAIPVVFIFLATVIVSFTLTMAYRGLSPLPLYDQWNFLRPSVLWSGLFALHNEHRIVFSKLVFIADLKFFGGRNLAEFWVTAFMLFGIAAIYGSASNLNGSASIRRRITVTTFTLCLVFNPLTIGVLLWGMHVQNVAVNFFGLLAFLLMARVPKPGRVIFVWLRIAALFLAVLGTFTSGSGPLIPCLLLLEACLLGLPKREIAMLSVFALLTIGFFVHGNPGGHSMTTTLLSNPGDVVRFFLIFLGSIVQQAITLSDSVQHETMAQILGLLSVVMFFLISAIGKPKQAGSEIDRFRIFVLVAGLFFILSAAIVSVARTPLGITSAFTEHYNTLRVLYWTNLLILLPAFRKTIRSYRIASVLAFCACLIIVTEIPKRQFGMHFRSIALNTSAAALASGVYGNEEWHRLNLWPASSNQANDSMRAEAEYLRVQKLSVFHDIPAIWLGTDLRFIPKSVDCSGSLSATHGQRDYLGAYQVLVGKVRARGFERSVPDIVLVDQRQKIVGFGATSSPAKAKEADWKAFTKIPAQKISPYILVSGRLCPIIGTQR